MALFTDGLVSSMDDLSAQDAQLADVATAENIDVTQKLALAQEEVALGLDVLLTGMNYPDQLSWLAPQPSVHRVVVTPALRLWHTYRALEMVYADAYNSQLNDRYANKRDQFHSMASWAYDKLIRIGAGVVLDPIPRAVMPGVMAVSGAPGALPDATYYATMAWTAAPIRCSGRTERPSEPAKPGPSPEPWRRPDGWQARGKFPTTSNRFQE